MTANARGEPRGWLLLLLLLVVLAVVYAPMLGAPFVWDDARLAGAPEVRNLDLSRAFLQPFWLGAPGEAGSLAFFRPLTSLSFALDYRLHADNPAGYHLSNLAFHFLTSCGLFALLRRRGLGPASSCALAGWWALLPRLTESVAWISGRGDALAGLFALAALGAYRAGSTGRLVLAGALALLSVLSKESGLATFAALGVLYFSERASGMSRARRIGGWLALALPLSLYMVLRVHAGASAGDALPLPQSLRAYAVLEAVGRYAWMIVDAFRPRTFMGRLGEPDWVFVALGALTLAVSVACLPRLRRAPPETGAYALLGLLPLALVLHVVPLPVTVVASDRYLYLPTLGLVLSVANASSTWLDAKRWRVAVLLLLALAGAVRASSRVEDYTDGVAFWLAAARGAPKEVTPIVELGTQAYNAGCFPEALQLYERALSLQDWSSPRGLENAALVANMSGNRARAAQLGELLLQRFPRVASLELRRAQLALAALDFEAARTHAERALVLAPQFTQAKGFLRMLEQAHAVWSELEARRAPIEARLDFEMRALRYPEAVATLRELLERPTTDERVARGGLAFVMRVGKVEDGQALLPLYRERYPAADATVLVNALNERVAASANLRRRLLEAPTVTG